MNGSNKEKNLISLTLLLNSQVFKIGKYLKSLVRYRGYDVIPQKSSKKKIKLVT